MLNFLKHKIGDVIWIPPVSRRPVVEIDHLFGGPIYQMSLVLNGKYQVYSTHHKNIDWYESDKFGIYKQLVSRKLLQRK